MARTYQASHQRGHRPTLAEPHDAMEWPVPLKHFAHIEQTLVNRLVVLPVVRLAVPAARGVSRGARGIECCLGVGICEGRRGREDGRALRVDGREEMGAVKEY